MKITKDDVAAHIKKLGLLSVEMHDASAVEAVLSQVRACVFLAGVRFMELGEDEMAPVIQSGLKTLNDLIGKNGVEVPIPSGKKVRKV